MTVLVFIFEFVNIYNNSRDLKPLSINKKNYPNRLIAAIIFYPLTMTPT